MKRIKRLISGLLCLVMIFSLFAVQAPALAVEDGTVESTAAQTGSIGLTLRFGLPQTRALVDSRHITLTISSEGHSVVVPLAGGTASTNDFKASVTVTAKNAEGTEMTTEEQIGYYEVLVDGLPTGKIYQLTVTGDGYVPYTLPGGTTLEGYSKHFIIGTGNGTFSLGDIDGNGEVARKDLEEMSKYLGKTDSSALALCDLNGDGQVDVTDLAYVEYLISVEGKEECLETSSLILPKVDSSHLGNPINAADLFSPDHAVNLTPNPAGGALEIPMTFGQPVDMTKIVLTSPDGSGAVQTGSARVEYTDPDTGEEAAEIFPFDISMPEGVHAIGRSAGESVVTIDLGRRLPVKRITITVTRVEGQAGEAPEFATVTQIEFLKDIVPQNPQKDASQVNGLTALPGSEKVELAWNAVQNITGYTVTYGTSQNSLTSTLEVNESRAVVSGLENLKEYFFQVTATNGDWKGTPSAVVSATPQPASVPGAPSNIRVSARSEALRVSWGKTKDASYYQVFFREAGSGEFQQSGGNYTTTSAVITGLTNDTLYEVAIKAGNIQGVGPFSATAKGTPELEEIKMPDLPTDGRIPNSQISSIVMTNPKNVDTSLCPQFQTNQLIDGDAATYWVARVWWESSEITYTFEEPQDMNYLILVPYLDEGHRGAIKNYSIIAKDTEGNVLTSGSYRAQSIGDKNYLLLTFPAVTGVKSLSVGLTEWEGNGCRVSISEMAFYTSDSLPEDIAALFANDSFTQLADGVSEPQIASLEARLAEKSSFYLDLELLQDELILARNLAADGSGLGTIRSGFQRRSGAADKQYGQSASDLQPMGVSVAVPDAVQAGASARTAVAVYAELPDDATVYVVPTQFFGESGIWRGAAIPLSNGRNYITIPQIGSLTDPRGGQLYITYAGNHPEAIKLQIRGNSNVTATPLLELSGWYNQSEAERREAIAAYVKDLTSYVAGLSGTMTTNVFNATEISTPSVLLSLPADQVLAGLRGVNRDEAAMAEVMYQNVLAWEDELFVANKVQGIIDSNTTLEDYRYPMETRQNIRYMRMFAGAFMYAAGNHVGIGYGSTSALAQGQPVSQTGAGNANGLFGWGIAHEIGHNMDKLGKAEITNNIYSLAIQAWDGGSMARDTRLTYSNIWNGIYDKVSAGRPGVANNVFVQLGMYWQLHLAYDEADEPLAFFNSFFKLWKAGEASGLSSDDRIAVIASQVVKRDLTDFFTRWGMTLSQEAKTQMGNFNREDRAIWYLNDASRTYRLNGGTGDTGTTTLSAAVADNTVTLSMTSTGSSVLGYEIRRNGKSVAFTTENTYTDNLGAANNLTYTYSVVPVDKLGNLGQEATAPEVRIAYDKAISPDLYTVSHDPATGTMTFTMTRGAVPVTGIKVTGSNLNGSYSVRVKAAASDEMWTPAKSGTLSGTEVVDYFNKPGAEADDTRIWTYDAAIVEVTGIPEGASVALLDYPGDRIDFHEGAAVGVLAEEYHYDGGSIPAGTLVVLGTYRGDPVYNTVEVQARYSTTAEADEELKTIERTMNGYALLLAEIPKDGEVSDISDGIFLYVPNLTAEENLNKEDGVTDSYPFEIRVVLYRTDDPYGAERPDGSESRRVTSETLWISFPEGEALPSISLVSGN